MNTQALCLAEKLDCQSSEVYVNIWGKNPSNFSFELLEFFIQFFFFIYKLVDSCFSKLEIGAN